MATYFIVGAAWSERESAERGLEQFTDELIFLVVESDTHVAVCTLSGALDEQVVRLSDVGVGHGTEQRRLATRADVVEQGDLRRTLKPHDLEQLPQEQKHTSCLNR